MKTQSLITKALLAASLLAPTIGHAQSVGSRGGGDVVVCYDQNKNITDMVAYDFWNASKQYTLNVTVDRTTPYMKQIEKNMERLKKIDPMFASHLLDIAQSFSPANIAKTVGFQPGIGDNGDSGRSIVPESRDSGCAEQEILRIAEFSVDPLPYERSYKITKYLWDHANESVKFAIVQHEIIYAYSKEAIEETQSTKAQLYNALISSNEFNTMTSESYQKFIKNLGWSKGQLFSIIRNGFTFSINSFFSRPNDKEAPYFGGYLPFPQNSNLGGKSVSVSYIDFLMDGTLRAIELAEASTLTTLDNTLVTLPKGSTVWIKNEKVKVADIEEANYLNPTAFQLLTVNDTPVKVANWFNYSDAGIVEYASTIDLCQLKRLGNLRVPKPGYYRFKMTDGVASITFDKDMVCK